jgi:hypothetical protein
MGQSLSVVILTCSTSTDNGLSHVSPYQTDFSSDSLDSGPVWNTAYHFVHLAYQPSANDTFLSEQISTSNQPTLLFSHNKSTPAASHQQNEQVVYLTYDQNELKLKSKQFSFSHILLVLFLPTTSICITR